LEGVELSMGALFGKTGKKRESGRVRKPPKNPPTQSKRSWGGVPTGARGVPGGPWGGEKKRKTNRPAKRGLHLSRVFGGGRCP